jgi:hypothetical protein
MLNKQLKQTLFLQLILLGFLDSKTLLHRPAQPQKNPNGFPAIYINPIRGQYTSILITQTTRSTRHQGMAIFMKSTWEKYPVLYAIMVGGHPMTSMINEVVMGAIMATDFGDISISSAMGRVMGSINATAAELDIRLDRNEPKKLMP